MTLFERADRIGGLLRHGIPSSRWRSTTSTVVSQMEAEGTVFRPGVNVGVDVTVEQLRADFDAVVLSVGSTIGRDLPIPGRELDGIHQAMEFCRRPTACSTATRSRARSSRPARRS